MDEIKNEGKDPEKVTLEERHLETGDYSQYDKIEYEEAADKIRDQKHRSGKGGQDDESEDTYEGDYGELVEEQEEEEIPEDHKLRRQLKAYKWLALWILAAGTLCAGIYFWQGQNAALDFAGGYIMELSLSIDNVFVFLMIFMSFGLDEKCQHRVLAWGIIGAIVLRFIFIFFGLELVKQFHWILYVFGVVLIISGLRMFKEEEEKDPHDSRVVRTMKKIIPMTTYFQDDRFTTIDDGRRKATPLLAVLVLIETSDIIFAVDSVPAVISITQDLFIVYTSNIMAILCLRQLYFVIEHMQERFAYVKYGVAVILMFTGVKMLIGYFGIHVGTVESICTIIVILVISIIASMIISARKKKAEEKDGR